MNVTECEEVQKWGLPLVELYRLALTFYKQNAGKAVHLSYEDNLKLIAFKQQASLGPFDSAHAPELGVLDVIGKDRRLHWTMLGDISREQAMEGFIDLLETMCSAFRPYVEAVKKNRDETLKADLLRLEAEKLEHENCERKQQELLEEGYKDEIQRRQLQDALNKQTYQQFKSYAEKQFPGNPEQQAVLIHQLQKEHYHQYMQQLQMHNQNAAANALTNNTGEANDIVNQSQAVNSDDAATNVQMKNENVQQQQQHQINDQEEDTTTENLGEGQFEQNFQERNSDMEDYVLISPAKIWTRPDIDEFKAEVSSGDGDGVITIGHGDTVTVRVPTNASGKCIFWEFATDNYDIGFGVFFEWCKPHTSEVTVHVSDSDDEDECLEEEYLSTTEDLEVGSVVTERNMISQNSPMKPPISIIVPIYRRECFNEVYVGSHAYPGEGVYLLKFDNSYSIWRSKTLYYRVYYER